MRQVGKAGSNRMSWLARSLTELFLVPGLMQVQVGVRGSGEGQGQHPRTWLHPRMGWAWTDCRHLS